jgi:hypothetical protein
MIWGFMALAINRRFHDFEAMSLIPPLRSPEPREDWIRNSLILWPIVVIE